MIVLFLSSFPGLVGYSKNVGIATNTPQDMLHVLGIVRSTGLRIMNNNALETSFGIAGKESNAGKIGYSLFTPHTLDIVGGGTAAHLRRIK